MKKKNLLFQRMLYNLVLIFIILISFGACKEGEEEMPDYFEYSGSELILLQDGKLEDQDVLDFCKYQIEYLTCINYFEFDTLKRFDKIYTFDNDYFDQSDKVFFTTTGHDPYFYINILMPICDNGKIFYLNSYAVNGTNLISLFKIPEDYGSFYVIISNGITENSKIREKKWFVTLFKVYQSKGTNYIELFKSDEKFEKAMSGVRRYEDFLKAWKKYKS